MAFYSPVGVERQYRVGRSRDDLKVCWSCGKQIPRKDRRVSRTNDSYHCYCSKECFEKAFKYRYTVDFDSGIISKNTCVEGV